MRSSSILAISAAVGLCLSAGVASATTPYVAPASYSNETILNPVSTLSFSPSVTTPTLWTANIYAGAPTTTGSFYDIFRFTDPVTPSSAPAGGSANGISLTGSGALSFSLVELVDLTTSSIVQNGVISGVGNSIANIFDFMLPNNSHNYAFVVNGTVSTGTASYGGSANISVVPEPKTYAMLLAGLGLLAFTARRRKTSFF